MSHFVADMVTDSPIKVPGGRGFNFDVIVVRLDLPTIQIDEASKLTVDVKFNKNSIKITSSRINVYEFKPGRSYEFNENPSVLKDQLFNRPLTCKISYDNKIIGNCDLMWPDSFINRITDTANELMHCEEIDIEDNGVKVGKMELNIRLQIKCQEFDENMVIEPKTNMCQEKDTVIDPNDILFVVGDDKNSTNNVCSEVGIIPASESQESVNAPCLDLSNFRTVNGKTVANTDILNSIDSGCCNLKKSANKYREMIESLIDKGKEFPLLCPEQTKSVDCESYTQFASCSTSGTSNPCRCISDESGFNCEPCNGGKETKRYCNFCRENITWLPKFTPCPKCGFKPINYPDEKPYNDQLTADKILQEFLNKNAKNEGTDPPCNESLPQQEKCRCSCANGKICAHCRIQKLCEDVFHTPSKEREDCGKCEVKSSEMYNVCKTNSSSCRPYLAKVFQELKDLYAKRESKKIGGENKDYKSQRTDCDCNNSPPANKLNELKKDYMQKRKERRYYNREDFVAAERKRFLIKNFSKQDALCKGKTFDYLSDRKYPGTKIRHKTCINGFAGRKNVPRNMGWLWSAEATGLRAGWQPGAIRKPIKKLMKLFLDNSGTFDNLKERCCDLKTKESKSKGENSNYDTEDDSKKPTLHICKKNGVYYVTLRPIKDAEALRECTDIEMKPIQFKITKSNELKEMRALKKYLKAMGFQKCTCHKPISRCCCRTFLEKKKLEYQCYKECLRRNMPPCSNCLVLSDTSDSEAEFDFCVTPPAGVPLPDQCIRKKKTVNSGTQYVEKDWIIKPEYPKHLSKYKKLYNCAVGQRFGKAFGPYGSEGYTAGATPIEGVYIPGNFKSDTKGQGGLGDIGAPSGHGGKKSFPIRGPQAFLGSDGKFSMAKYWQVKALTKPSPAIVAEKKKQKMTLLKGSNPPLLCMVDRRGKPRDPCAPCFPTNCEGLCLCDNRIC